MTAEAAPSAAEIRTVAVDRDAIASHLATLFGGTDAGWISVFAIAPEVGGPKATFWFDVGASDGIAQAVDCIASQSARANVFIGVNLQKQRLPGNQRGGTETVAAVTALVYDLDIGGADHPATRTDALAFVRSWPLPPSFIVYSGRGLHLYWLLHEAYSIGCDDERLEVVDLSRRWGELGHRFAAQLGYRFDTVSDLARILRPAGSVHRKDPRDPRPVHVLNETGARYALADFEDVLPVDLPTDAEAPPAPDEGKAALSEAQLTKLVRLLLPAWADGSRHRTAMLVSGWLANNGVAEASALDLVQRLSTTAGDLDPDEKQKTARDTYRALRDGKRPLGWVGLKSILMAKGAKPAQITELDRVLKPTITIGGRPAPGKRTSDRDQGGGGAPPDNDEPQDDERETSAPGGNNRPEIDAGDQNLERSSDLAWNALRKSNNPPRLFRFGAVPVRIDRPDDDHVPVAQTLDENRLSHELARSAHWFKETEKAGVRPAAPPMRTIKDMLAAPSYPFPPLLSIVQAPTFAKDGSLHSTPGYNPATRSFYAPPAGLEIPAVSERPTSEDVERARNFVLDDLIGQFEFISIAERANALTVFFEPYVRNLIAGGTPLRLFEAPTAGVGKGLLAAVLVQPAVGRRINLVTLAGNEEEMRKALTAQLLAAPEVVLFDNISRPIDSGILAATLTAEWWSDRRLGSNDMIHVPVRCLWLATGNNPTMSTEIARRTVRIRLDPKVDRPWQRVGFKHEDLRSWAEENRGRLIWAALTIVRAWLNQGAPKSKKRLGSFEQWAAVMGGILESAGIEGFLDNLDEFYEVADTEGAIWRQFVGAWFEKFGEQETGAAELFEIALSTEGFDLGKGGERAQRTSFGMRLGKQRDRVIGDYRIMQTRTVQRAKRWRLMHLRKPDPADPCEPCEPLGTFPNPISREETSNDSTHTGNKKDPAAERFLKVHKVHMDHKDHNDRLPWDEPPPAAEEYDPWSD